MDLKSAPCISGNGSNFAFTASLLFWGIPFNATIVLEKDGIVMAAGITKPVALSLNDFLDKTDLKDFLNRFLELIGFRKDISISISKADVAYRSTGDSSLGYNFGIKIKDDAPSKIFSSIELILEKKLSQSPFIGINFGDSKIFLSNLPIIGNYITNNDGYVQIHSVIYKSGDKGGLSVSAEAVFFGYSLPLPSEKNDSPDSPKKNTSVEEKTGSTDESSDSVKWFDINKSVKFISLKKIGFEFKNSRIFFYITVAVEFSILSVEIIGLYVSLPIIAPTDIKQYQFGIRGMFLAFDKPPVSIAGGLYKINDTFTGMVSVKVKDFSITAIGSYTDKTGIFMYALVTYPIGGPPCFFIRGIALGFGTNWCIRMPSLEEVKDFPFVAAALRSNGTGNKTPSLDESDKMLEQLKNKYLTSAKGYYFGAVGVKFSSFGIANSFALLLVELGKRTRISILGFSEIIMPVNSTKPILYAELALRAVLDIDEGYLEIVAALTPKSYVFDKNCRLTGGFALAVWMQGSRKGDFIITLGGCHHPLFTKKDLYPKVEKIGVNWEISKNLKLKGAAYFAVTPSCVMAGCSLSLNYDSGNLHAWLYADASFFMTWEPLFYDIAMNISVGIKYRFKLFWWWVNICLELGVSLHLWGPEFSGIATIHLWCISFTIGFGAKNIVKPKPLNWDNFCSRFFPDAVDPNKIQTECGEIIKTNGKALCRIIYTAGIISEHKEKEIVIVNPINFSFNVKCQIPCSGFSVNSNSIENTVSNRAQIQSMGIKQFTLLEDIVIKGSEQEKIDREDPEQWFEYAIITENLSEALFGSGGKKPQDVINASFVKDLSVGIKFTAKKPKLWGNPIIMPVGPEIDTKDFPHFVENNGEAEYKIMSDDDDICSSFDKLDSTISVLSKVFDITYNVNKVQGGIFCAPLAYFTGDIYNCKTGSIIKNG